MKDSKFYNQLEKYLYNNFRSQTAKSYNHLIKRFLRQYPNADYLSISDIETYFLKLKSKGNKVNYRNTILSAIKVYYDFIIHIELITHHPCKSYYITEKKPSGFNFNAVAPSVELTILLLSTKLNAGFLV